MSRELNVPVFAEDNAHEQFVTAVLRKLGVELGVRLNVNVVSARGGHGQALAEFRAYQLALEKQRMLGGLLVVAIDANCAGWSEMRSRIRAAIREQLFVGSAIACPDPHIERWYLADPVALSERFPGTSFQLPRRKCERDLYKRLLHDCLSSAGEIVMLGGAEFAADIVDAMSFYRAGKQEPSLKAFIEDLRTCILAQQA